MEAKRRNAILAVAISIAFVGGGSWLVVSDLPDAVGWKPSMVREIGQQEALDRVGYWEWFSYNDVQVIKLYEGQNQIEYKVMGRIDYQRTMGGQTYQDYFEVALMCYPYGQYKVLWTT